MTFEGLNNIRDLGGLKTADGRVVKAGKLFRSDQLSKASANDLPLLESLGLTMIIDLRSDEESLSKPDPAVSGAEYIHLPAIKDLAAGITRSETSDTDAVSTVIMQSAAATGFAGEYMAKMYGSFVSDDFIRGQYSRFVSLLARSDSERVLWHCTAGKDRAGFAAVIVLSLLGVPRETVEEDYLKTNACLADEVEALVAKHIPPSAPDSAKEAVRILFGARKEFLDALYSTAERLYGSFDGFLANGLGVTDETKRRLKSIYLEQL